MENTENTNKTLRHGRKTRGNRKNGHIKVVIILGKSVFVEFHGGPHLPKYLSQEGW